MLKNTITKENLHTFLANSQKITTRAIRLAEEQNLEKYEREAMGALMKAAGYYFIDGLEYVKDCNLTYLEENEALFDYLVAVSISMNILDNTVKH